MANFKTYTIADDTANGVLDTLALDDQLKKDPTLADIYDGINRTQGSGVFTSHVIVEMTTEIENAMDAIVAAHDGVPIPSEPVDAEGRPIITSAPFSDTAGFFFRGMGIKGIATKSADGITPVSTNIDYTLTQDRYINGVRLILKNQDFEDTVYFEIVDTEFSFAGILYPATPFDYGIPVPEETPWSAIMPEGMTLNQFGKDWNLTEESDQGREVLKYPANLKAGMTIRIVFKTYSQTDVKVKCNFYLHEKQGS